MYMILKVEIPCGSNPEITVAKHFIFLNVSTYQSTSTTSKHIRPYVYPITFTFSGAAVINCYPLSFL